MGLRTPSQYFTSPIRICEMGMIPPTTKCKEEKGQRNVAADTLRPGGSCVTSLPLGSLSEKWKRRPPPLWGCG